MAISKFWAFAAPQDPVIIPMELSQTEGRMDAEHGPWAASDDAFGAAVGGGGLTSSQTEEMRKKGKNKGKHEMWTAEQYC